MMPYTHEPQEPPLILPPKPAPAPAPAVPREIAPGILRDPDGKLRTNIPPPAVSHFVEPEEEDLPYGFNREADGRLTYRCPRCDRRDVEYFGPAELDPTWPCGGSQWCLP